jgi:hypothetical protein
VCGEAIAYRYHGTDLQSSEVPRSWLHTNIGVDEHRQEDDIDNEEEELECGYEVAGDLKSFPIPHRIKHPLNQRTSKDNR